MKEPPPGILSHVSIGTNDFDRAAAFYDAALGAIGIKRVMEFPGAASWGRAFPEFWVQVPQDGKPASTANGVHISFLASSEKEVQDFYDAAMKAGGKDEGAPGPRPAYGAAYYACFVRDPDGHKVEIMFWDEHKAGPELASHQAQQEEQAMREFTNLDEYKAAVGQEIGVGGWFEIDQKRIQDFADATGDHQWIHLDAERCKRELNMPTIAHGYLTLSLLPKLSANISRVKSVTRGINYGANKVRFTNMVPSGSKVRARAKLMETSPKAGGLQCITEMTIEVEGQERPAMVAETISLLYE